MIIKIRGLIREAETEIALPGFFVKAYDKDLLFDDLLGSTYTDKDGRFEILTEPEDFRDFFDVKPDIYLKIFGPDAKKLLYSTEHAIRWNAGKFEEFDVRIPRDCLGDLAPTRAVRLLDENGNERSDYDIGESLIVHVDGLHPGTAHDVVLLNKDGEALFTNTMMTNSDGVIEATNMWPQIGLEDINTGEPISIEQAQEQWQGLDLMIEIRKNGKVAIKQAVKLADAFKRPLLLSTDEDGIVSNGFEAGSKDAVVSGHNIPFQGHARIFMVSRQHNWQEGDTFLPIRLVSGRSAFVDVDINNERRFRARLARARELEPGAYDFIVRQLRYGYEDDEDLVLRAADTVTRTLTGLVVREEFMASKFARGGCANIQQISGRSISGRPYFRYTNVFPVGANVYGALDPNALDPNHQGKMVALYVVQHKNATQWSADNSLTHLPVLGGNSNVIRFKTQTGCINANKHLLWANANQVGEYDIVADFGNNTPDASAFTPDNSFDQPLDMIDGYVLAGFRLVPDPTSDTSFIHAGTFEYNEGSITVTDNSGFFDPYRGQTGSTSPETVMQKAVVYFPADGSGKTDPSDTSAVQGSYPMFIVVHGNSSSTNSYQGYNYLLEHMARNGFIAASIHLKPNMIGRGRAEMLFKHIDILKTKFGSKAANNIGIMGHSRGGEAVVIAARMNHSLGLGHNINAIISLAPTDHFGRETLGGAYATPYLVIYGSMDGDVSGGPLFGNVPSKTGFSLYDRANGEHKSMIFVHGSTHGRYNTVWGDTDITASWSSLTPADHPKLINADAHQKIAKSYMSAFCRQHMLGHAQWKGMFTGEWVPPAVELADSGKVRLFAQYQDTTKTLIDNFEGAHTATSWQTSTIGDTVGDDNSLPVDPQEDQLHLVDVHSPHDSAGVLLRWDGTSDQLWLDVPTANKNVTAFNTLSFRITQRVDSASNPSGIQDLYATLKDTSNKSRGIKVSKFAEVPEPHTRGQNSKTKSAMRTVRIPLHAYTIKVAGGQDVDLANITRIIFDFGVKPTGEIEIDSIEFTD